MSAYNTSQMLLLCVQLLQMSIFAQKLQFEIQKEESFRMSTNLLSLEEKSVQAHGTYL